MAKKQNKFNRVCDNLRVTISGLLEKDAIWVCRHAGFELRVIERDNTKESFSKEYKPERVNVEILNGRVVSSFIG